MKLALPALILTLVSGFFSSIGLLLTSPGVSQWLPTLLVVSAVRIKNGFRALNTLSIKAQPKR